GVWMGCGEEGVLRAAGVLVPQGHGVADVALADPEHQQRPHAGAHRVVMTLDRHVRRDRSRAVSPWGRRHAGRGPERDQRSGGETFHWSTAVEWSASGLVAGLMRRRARADVATE